MYTRINKFGGCSNTRVHSLWVNGWTCVRCSKNMVLLWKLKISIHFQPLTYQIFNTHRSEMKKWWKIVYAWSRHKLRSRKIFFEYLYREYRPLFCCHYHKTSALPIRRRFIGALPMLFDRKTPFLDRSSNFQASHKLLE